MGDQALYGFSNSTGDQLGMYGNPSTLEVVVTGCQVTSTLSENALFCKISFERSKIESAKRRFRKVDYLDIPSVLLFEKSPLSLFAFIFAFFGHVPCEPQNKSSWFQMLDFYVLRTLYTYIQKMWRDALQVPTTKTQNILVSLNKSTAFKVPHGHYIEAQKVTHLQQLQKIHQPAHWKRTHLGSSQMSLSSNAKKTTKHSQFWKTWIWTLEEKNGLQKLPVKPFNVFT